jgi:hypothetical protein
MDDDVADTEPQRAHLCSGTATRRTERLTAYAHFMYSAMDPRPRSGVPAQTVRHAPRSRARPRRARPHGCARVRLRTACACSRPAGATPDCDTHT